MIGGTAEELAAAVAESRNWDIAESTLAADIEFTPGVERPSPSPDAPLLDEDELELAGGTGVKVNSLGAAWMRNR